MSTAPSRGTSGPPSLPTAQPYRPRSQKRSGPQWGRASSPHLCWPPPASSPRPLRPAGRSLPSDPGVSSPAGPAAGSLGTSSCLSPQDVPVLIKHTPSHLPVQVSAEWLQKLLPQTGDSPSASAGREVSSKMSRSSPGPPVPTGSVVTEFITAPIGLTP